MDQIYAKYERMARENPDESFVIVDLERKTVVRDGRVDNGKCSIRVRQFGENVEVAADDDDEFEKSGFYRPVRAHYRCKGDRPSTAKKRRVGEWRSESAAASRPPDRRLLEDFTNDKQRSLVSGHRSCFGDRPPPQKRHSKLDKTLLKSATAVTVPMRVSRMQLSRLLDGKVSETIRKYMSSARRWSGRIREIQKKNLKNARAELEALCFPNVAVGCPEQRRRTQMVSPGRLHGLLSKLGFTTTTQHIKSFIRNGVPIAELIYDLIRTEGAQTQIFNLESLFFGQKWCPPVWDQRSGIGCLPTAITIKLPTREDSEQPLRVESMPSFPEWRRQWVDAWVSSTITELQLAERELEEDRFRKGLRWVRSNQLEMSSFICPLHQF